MFHRYVNVSQRVWRGYGTPQMNPFWTHFLSVSPWLDTAPRAELAAPLNVQELLSTASALGPVTVVVQFRSRKKTYRRIEYSSYI